MMSITVKDNHSDQLEVYFWEVGTAKSNESTELILRVVEVCADGSELQHIRSKFRGLPNYVGNTVRYFGDHARFIIANL